MRICVAGAYGAFGTKHLDAIADIDDVTVTAVMGADAVQDRRLGFRARHWICLDLA